MAVGSRPLVPSRLAPGGVAHGGRHASTTLVGAYLALTKPRIIELLLITTVPAMVLAQQGWPSTALVVVTLIGGTLAAGGANAFNMYVDRDIDRLMERTKNRPLATGRIEPRHALVFAAHSRSSRSACCGGAPTCSRRSWPCPPPRSTSSCTPSG
jgi:protoheme IX farnesyltransferase